MSKSKQCGHLCPLREEFITAAGDRDVNRPACSILFMANKENAVSSMYGKITLLRIIKTLQPDICIPREQTAIEII